MNTGFESLELQSAELLWALLGITWLVGSGQAGVCPEDVNKKQAWVLHVIPNPH